MKTALIAAAAAALAMLVRTEAQPVPLPNSYPGLKWGSPSAPVMLEAFLDLLCPDCAAAFPTVYGQVLPHYGPDKLYFVLHLFPLPYHLMAFTVAQSALVVQNINGTDAAALAWSNWMFANQDKYENNGTMSTTQVTSMLAADVQSVMGISQAQFLQGMNDPDLNENTRIGWKYGCSRGTTGTPNFMVNGLQVAADETWTLSDWEQLLDPLYQTAEERKASRAKAREQRSGC